MVKTMSILRLWGLPLLWLMVGAISLGSVWYSGGMAWQALVVQAQTVKTAWVQEQSQLQRAQAWQGVSPAVLMRYQGLRASGQWDIPSRLTWLHGIEQLSQKYVQTVSHERFSFSERQVLPSDRVVGWSNLPFQLRGETLQVEAIARHEWHTLRWLNDMNDRVLPTGLLQSCDWQLLETPVDQPPLFSGRIRVACRWLLLEIQE